MPPALHATLTYRKKDIEDLLRAHTETQGYYVESIKSESAESSSEGAELDALTVVVSVRPMTPEERAVHDLPSESVEERMQAKMDALVEETTHTFKRLQGALDRQERDMKLALSQRLEELQELNASVLETMTDIQELAAEQALASIPQQDPAPLTKRSAPAAAAAPTANASEPMTSYLTDEADTYGQSAPAPPTAPAPPEPASFKGVTAISFADAVTDLRNTQTNAEVSADHLRRQRYAELHREIEADADNTPPLDIEGSSFSFPSDAAI